LKAVEAKEAESSAISVVSGTVPPSNPAEHVQTIHTTNDISPDNLPTRQNQQSPRTSTCEELACSSSKQARKDTFACKENFVDYLRQNVKSVDAIKMLDEGGYSQGTN
jgi:hypothetical protein